LVQLSSQHTLGIGGMKDTTKYARKTREFGLANNGRQTREFGLARKSPTLISLKLPDTLKFWLLLD